VQGVSFRQNTKEEADKLGVKGSVENLPSGEVEAFFEGSEDKVEEMIKWCGKGPFGSAVSDLEIKREKYIGEFDSFEIIR
jgi:acylphosphatase